MPLPAAMGFISRGPNTAPLPLTATFPRGDTLGLICSFGERRERTFKNPIFCSPLCLLVLQSQHTGDTIPCPVPPALSLWHQAAAHCHLPPPCPQPALQVGQGKRPGWNPCPSFRQEALEHVRGSTAQNCALYLQMINVSRMQSCSGIWSCPEPAEGRVTIPMWAQWCCISSFPSQRSIF